jgi:hypothetical protein
MGILVSVNPEIGAVLMTSATAATQSRKVEKIELFTEAEIESIVLQLEDLENLEAAIEEDLETISFEDVAETLEAYFEGESVEEGLERRRRRRRRSVNKRLLNFFFRAVKKVLKPILRNPKTRAKLQAVCRKGADAVVLLITPVITPVLTPIITPALSWMVPIFLPPVIRALFRVICKEVGIHTETVEAIVESAASGITMEF